MINLESPSRSTTLVEFETSCTVAEFNAADGQLRAEGAPLIAFTWIAVPSRPGARLRLDNRDMGPLGELGGKVLPEPGFVEAWYTPSRTGTKMSLTDRPEPYKKRVRTNEVHHILQNNGLEVPEGGYVSSMNYDTMRIEGADPDERVEIRGINIRCETEGIRYWMFA
jgi:hypothetical protein